MAASRRYTKAESVTNRAQGAIESSMSALTLRLRLSGASIYDSPYRVSSLASDTKALRDTKASPSETDTKNATFERLSTIYEVCQFLQNAANDVDDAD